MTAPYPGPDQRGHVPDTPGILPVHYGAVCPFKLASRSPWFYGVQMLFVVDLDRTLLRSDGNLSAFSRDGLNRLLAGGARVTFSTARSLLRARAALDGVELRHPLALYNGAVIVNALGETIRMHVLDSEIVRTFLARAAEHDLHPYVFTVSQGRERLHHRAPQNAGQKNFLAQRKGDSRLTTEPILGDVVSIMIVARREQLLPLFDVVQTRCGAFLMEDLHAAGFHALEIVPLGIDKGSALRDLASLVGVSMRETTVFGDHQNDLPMFEVAGRAVAVSNAHETVRARAHLVIGTNDEDAVVKHLLDLSFPNF